MAKFLLTMQHEEHFLLPIFLAHYTRYFPEDCIYVIDHGSKVDTIYRGINRILVPRDKPFSELARLNLIKSIAHGLLQYFDWGVYADCDELIAMQCADERTLRQVDVLHVVGFETYQGSDVQPGGRLFGLLSPLMCKPLLFNKTPNWNVGFHMAVGVTPPAELKIPMAHVRFLYPEHAAGRLAVRRAIPDSMPLAEKREGMAEHWARGVEVLEEFQQFTKQLAERQAPIVPFAAVRRDEVLKEFHASTPGGGKAVYWGAQAGYEAASVRHDLTSQFAHLVKV
jgi:hypothetical protein